MNICFIGNGQRKISFCIAKNLTGKLYFRKVWCHFCNLVQRGETIHCLQVQNFVESQHYRRKENITLQLTFTQITACVGWSFRQIFFMFCINSKHYLIIIISWHLTKSPVEGDDLLGTCRSSPSVISTVNSCSCQCLKKGILLKHQGTDVL